MPVSVSLVAVPRLWSSFPKVVHLLPLLRVRPKAEIVLHLEVKGRGDVPFLLFCGIDPVDGSV